MDRNGPDHDKRARWRVDKEAGVEKSDIDDNWVIPVPDAAAPQFALVPWALYERLLARAAAYADENGESTDALIINHSDPVQTVPVQNVIVERRQAPRMAPVDSDWTPDETDLEGFKGVLSKEQMPLDALDRLLDGDHPVKVFRKLRGLTQKDLAAITGLNATYLSQIETRKRGGSTRVYRRLAVALSVDIGDLID